LRCPYILYTVVIVLLPKIGPLFTSVLAGLWANVNYINISFLYILTITWDPGEDTNDIYCLLNINFALVSFNILFSLVLYSLSYRVRCVPVVPTISLIISNIDMNVVLKKIYTCFNHKFLDFQVQKLSCKGTKIRLHSNDFSGNLQTTIVAIRCKKLQILKLQNLKNF